MSEEKHKIIKFNCFSNFKLDNNKEKQMTIHETIQGNKQFILDFFSKQSYFDELMPKFKKVSRGTNFYNGMIRKGIKHKSVFFQAIMKTIKKVNEEKDFKSPKSVKRIRLYKLPKIEELKLKKNQIDNNNKKKKIKILQIEKYKNIANEIKSNPSTTIHSKIKISLKKPKLAHSNTLNIFNNSLMRGNNTSTNFYKKGNSTEQHSKNNLLLSPGYNDISTYYNSNLNSNSLYKSDSIVNNSYKILKRAKSLNYINNFLNKCQEEIVTGKEMEGKVNDYNQKFTKEIQEKLNNNRLINRDYKVIEEKKKKNKYMELEEINYANIKRKMNEKISTSFAYRNRKELQEILKINTNAKAIILHLNEMNKINEKMGRRRIIERKRIDEINSLCENGYRKKEYLKSKIDIINSKNKEMNKLNQSSDYLPNDNYYMIKNNNELKGTLVPKLISLKKEAEKKIKIGSSLNNINH